MYKNILVTGGSDLLRIYQLFIKKYKIFNVDKTLLSSKENI